MSRIKIVSGILTEEACKILILEKLYPYQIRMAREEEASELTSLMTITVDVLRGKVVSGPRA